MIVSINQPYYLPWLGYFDRVKRSDVHIVLDHVQLEKGGFTNRTRITQRDGRQMWLTIPVPKGEPINRIACYGNWRHKHARSLYQSYPDFPQLCSQWFDRTYLVGVLKQATDWLSEQLGVESDWQRSSWLGGSKLGAKSDLVLNLCKEAGATQYLSGAQGRNYLDLPAFERAGIEVLFHEMPGDKPTLDYLFNPKEHTWPQAHLTSAHSSLASAEAVEDRADPRPE